MKWNVMPLIRRGSNFVFFAALYCSCLEFNAMLALPQRREAIKALNPRIRKPVFRPLLALFNKMDSRRQVKFTSSA